MTTQEMAEMLTYVADRIHASRNELTNLDRATGDGDHGVSMDIGWRAIVDALDDHEEQQPFEAMLRKAGLAFLNKVGATVGPLYGTAFLDVATYCQGKRTLTKRDIEPLFATVVNALFRRGKARLGDKTMMDVWEPALCTFRNHSQNGFLAAGLATAKSANDSAENTAHLHAKVGRASRLGNRSVGVVDAGAQSAAIIIKAVIEWLIQHYG